MIVLLIIVFLIIVPLIKDKFSKTESESVDKVNNDINISNLEERNLRRLRIWFWITFSIGTIWFVGSLLSLVIDFSSLDITFVITVLFLFDSLYLIPTILLIKIIHRKNQLKKYFSFVEISKTEQVNFCDEFQCNNEEKQQILDKNVTSLSEMMDDVTICKQDNGFVSCFFNESVLINNSFRSGGWEIRKWIVDEFDYVKKGEGLFILNSFYARRSFPGQMIKAPVSGFLHKREKFFVNQDDLICEFYENLNQLVEDLSVNEVEVVKDDFSEDIFVRGKIMAGLRDGYAIGKIRIIFENRMGEYSLLVKFNRKAINIRKTDTLYLLFEDGTNIKLNALSGPVKCVNKKEESAIRYGLKIEHIDVFKKLALTKWQIKTSDGEILGGADVHHLDKGIGLVFKDFIVKFDRVVKQNISEIDLQKYEIISESENQDTASDCCCVYLMKDTANQYYKVGISNKPEYRERTLQSEKPTIELICNKEFPSRKMARAIESALHTTYSDKHIRGEWFCLDESDVADVKKTLS